MVTNRQERAAEQFWLKWFEMTALGVLPIMVIFSAMAYLNTFSAFFAAPVPPTLATAVSDVPVLVPVAIVLSIPLGLAQAWALRGSLIKPEVWALVTVAGASVGILSGWVWYEAVVSTDALATVNGMVSAWVLFAAVLGCAQWLLLRSKPNSVWWVAINIVGQIAGWLTALLIGGEIPVHTMDTLADVVPIFLIAAPLAYGYLSGWALENILGAVELKRRIAASGEGRSLPGAA